MRTDLGRGHSKLSKPAVVGAGISWHGPGIYLAYPHVGFRNRKQTHSKLRPPAVVTQPLVQIFFGPKTSLAVTRAAGQLRRRSLIHSKLRPPVVVTAAPTQIFFGPSVTLAVTRAAGQIRKRNLRRSVLRPPAVIGAGIAWHGPGVYLTRLRPTPPTISFLRPPIEEEAVVEVISYGPEVHLTRIRPPRVYPDLGQPIVVDSGAALGWIGISLAPSRRVRTQSFLREPVVAPAVVVVYFGPQTNLVRRRTPAVHSFLRPPVIPPLAEPTRITLTPQRRGAPHSFLKPPTVVFLAVEISGPEVSLTRIKPPPVRSHLFPPAVVTAVVVEVFYGPDVHLTLGRRGAPQSLLRPPVVVFEAVELHGPQTTLARITPPLAQSRLRPPTVVDVAVEALFGPDVHLTYSRRGEPTCFLTPPTVVFPFFARQPQIFLAPQARGIPKSHLFPPVVVRLAVEILGPEVTLTPSRRPITKSRLEPPTVVAPVVSYGPAQWLTYSRRGKPKSILRLPRVLAQAPAYQAVLPPWLTYSRRGRPTYFLSPPTRVFPFFARKTEISLAPQRRGAPHSFLRPPQVVRLAVEIYGPETWLTYSRRGRPQYRLEPPTVLGKPPFRGIEITLARIKPRPTVALIKPPTVVRVSKADVLRVYLTYSRRGRPVYFTTPFTPGKAPFRPIRVTLTRIRPRPTVSLIKPPSVVGAGIAFFGPQITLVRIKHPPVQHFLRLTLVAFRRPQGDVCGFDIAGSFVCYLELPGSQVSGSSAAGSQITGSSRAGSTMTGSESEGGSVSGSDRKAT